MNRMLWGAVLVSVVSACGSAGDERQACFPNKTCNTGLVCLSDVCVKDEGRGGGSAGGGTATAGGSVAAGGTATAGGSVAAGGTATAGGVATAGGSVAGGTATAGGSVAGGTATAGGSVAGGTATAGGSVAGGIAGGAAGGSSAGGGTAGGSACVDSACPLGEGCRNGTCQFAFSGLTILAPDAGTLVAPTVAPIRATLDLGAGFSGANHPQSIQFSAPNLDMGTLTRQGNEYQGSLIVPASATGTFRLTVSYGAGANLVSDSRLLAVVQPLRAALRWNTNQAQRDQVVLGLLQSERPLSTAQVTLGGLTAATVPDSRCQAEGLSCPSNAVCRCVEVDVSQTPVPGLTATLPSSFQVTDLNGISTADAGSAVAVTRVRWVRPASETPGNFFSVAPPALDRAGNVYVTNVDTGSGNVAVLSADGGVLGTLPTSGRTSHVAMGRFAGQEVAYTAWGGGGSASLRGFFTSNQQPAGSLTSVFTAGTSQAPVVLVGDGGTNAVATTFGEISVAFPMSAQFRLTTLETSSTTFGSIFNVQLPTRTAIPPNLVAAGGQVYAPGELSSLPTLVAFSPTSPTITPLPGLVDGGTTLGQAATNVSVIISGERLWGPPFSTTWTVQPPTFTQPGFTAVRGNGSMVLGVGTNLLSLDTSGNAAVIHTGTQPIVMSPVLGRARGASPALGYAVTNGGEVVVFEGNTVRYTMTLPVSGSPVHPTLDCNRARPGSNTGILYVQTNTLSVIALVVDSPGLDPNAIWPKYQRTAGNHGNTSAAFPLNDGCP